jgi:hypothetical protein
VHGITEPSRVAERCSTFAITIADASSTSDAATEFGPNSTLDPDVVTQALCAKGVYCTSGNHYNMFWNDAFGLSNTHGATR